MVPPTENSHVQYTSFLKKCHENKTGDSNVIKFKYGGQRTFASLIEGGEPRSGGGCGEDRL